MPTLRTSCLLLLGTLCGLPFALASSVEEVPVEFQARGSDLVVIATYDGERYTVQVDPTTKIPFKEQVVTVTSCAKKLSDPEDPEGPGICPPTVIVRAIGGEVPAYDKSGNIILSEDGTPLMLWVPDNEAMPWLRSGEHVLFLTGNGVPEGQYRLLGAAKGMRRIHEDETTKTKMVTLPIANWDLLSEAGRARATNLRIKAVRDSLSETKPTVADAKTTIPRGPYYADTVSLAELESLVERTRERTRGTPRRR